MTLYFSNAKSTNHILQDLSQGTMPRIASARKGETEIIDISS